MLGESYFNMVHDHERVDYLLMEQNFMREIAANVNDRGEFLNDGYVNVDHKYLGSSTPNKNEEKNMSFLTIASTIAIVFLLGFLLKHCYKIIYRNAINETKSNVKFDCEQAILKKYKLES